MGKNVNTFSLNVLLMLIHSVQMLIWTIKTNTSLCFYSEQNSNKIILKLNYLKIDQNKLGMVNLSAIV